MIFLIVSILFITASAMVFRWSADHGANAIEVNAIFRLIGGAIALLLLVPNLGHAPFADAPLEVWAWGIAGGLFYWLAGFANLRASGLGHLGITWAVSRSAMVLPTLASMLIWQEVAVRVDSPQLWLASAGVLLTLVALVAFALDRVRSLYSLEAAPRRWYVWLVISFFMQGIWELTLRASGGFAAEQHRLVYLALVFGFAMLLSAGSLLAIRRLPARNAWKFGLLAGICTVIGTGVRPWALRDLPGVLVFPATAVGVILLTQTASAVLWKSRMTRYGYIGVLAAIAGVIVLSLCR